MSSSSDSDSEPPAKKAKSLPVCPYAATCYRKNPQHFKEFSHPGKDGKDSLKGAAAVTPKKSSAVEKTKLPPCEYGAKCYRKNLLHFAEFSHPTSGGATSASVSVPEDSGSDTDVMESDEEDKKKPTGSKDNGLLNRGASLIKKYSQMTESERKELIQKAMEMKEQLQKELQETKKQVQEKEKELGRLQEQMNTGVLLVEGEKEALEGDKIKYFALLPERQYKEGSAAQVHFRLAESQFYRLLSGAYSNQYRVTKVEYVVNPAMVKKFNKSRDSMKKTRGEEFSFPILAFHGTEEKNIVPICQTGFRVPVGDDEHRCDEGYYGRGVYFSEFPGYSMDYIAEAEVLLLAKVLTGKVKLRLMSDSTSKLLKGTDDPKLKHRTGNEGYYGKGIYFSEYTQYSLSYVTGSTKIMLNKVLLGKVYHCPGMALGKPLTAGYDSHMSPCKKELVIYHSERILPCYIVHYKNTTQEFKYLKPPEERRKVTKKDELMKIYWKAKKAKKTSSLAGRNVHLIGKLCDTEEELGKLIKKHGGSHALAPAPPKKKKGRGFGWGFGSATAAPHVFFNLLVATEEEYKKKVDPAFAQATTNKAPIIRQEFLYDSIIQNERLEPENYDLED